MKRYKALTIAGSDSGGGAGIQADLKTFAAMGVYGASVITSVTAQNTVGVSAIEDLSAEIIAKQIDAVMTDIRPSAVKTGMLSNVAAIRTVADGLRRYDVRKLVVDPVMVAKSGDRLLAEGAVETFKARILPLAFVITPNIPEAEILSGLRISNDDARKEAARIILQQGPRYVLIKGGHLKGDASDLLFDGKKFSILKARRIRTNNTHGTGCTFSAAITAELAKGATVEAAFRNAKKYITAAIAKSYSVGNGHGPVHHFYRHF